MKGKIVKYFSYRGFGFITPEDSSDEIFFHVSNYPEVSTPEIGVELEFELLETPKGKEATNIKLSGDVEESEPKEEEEEEVEVSEPEPEETSEASSMDISEIKGVGKATEEKLKNAGYESVELLASDDAETVSEKTGISAKVAAKIVASAKELLA